MICIRNFINCKDGGEQNLIISVLDDKKKPKPRIITH